MPHDKSQSPDAPIGPQYKDPVDSLPIEQRLPLKELPQAPGPQPFGGGSGSGKSQR